MEEKLMIYNGILQSDTEAVINDSETVEFYKKECDWFIIVEDDANEQNVFKLDNFQAELKNGIITGKFQADQQIHGYFKNESKRWTKQDMTIKDFIKDFDDLKMLYEPIWTHALIGLKWGVYIGIALKLLDTAILFGSVDPSIAFLFILAIGISFIPNIGVFGMMIVAIGLSLITGVNLYIAAIAATLTGGILGCMPGMFIGGIIGWIRKGSLPKAHDAIVEPASILIKTIVFPMIAAFVLIYSYIIYFNPWLMSLLDKNG